MAFPEKEIHCRCGNVMTLQTRKLRCVKCGRFLFYNDQEQRRHHTAQIYTVAMLALGIGIITYLFIEMIVEPLFG